MGQRRRSTPPAREDAVIGLNEIQRYWHDVAPWYDGDLSGSDRDAPSRSAAEVRAWELLFRRTLGPPPRRVLDVGTGTGNVALLLASFGYEVTAVDAVPRMLDITRSKAERAGLRLTLQRALAAELPFEPATFDAVTSRLVLWTQPEPERTVAAWARVARPGGRVVTIEGLHGPQDTASRWVRHRLARTILRLQGKPAGFLDDNERLDQLPLGRVRDPAAYRNTFVRAGLERVLVEQLHGIHTLQRRQTPLQHRLWPSAPEYLVEGTVPGAPLAPDQGAQIRPHANGGADR